MVGVDDFTDHDVGGFGRYLDVYLVNIILRRMKELEGVNSPVLSPVAGSGTNVPRVAIVIRNDDVTGSIPVVSMNEGLYR